jgi:hypothetical protein
MAMNVKLLRQIQKQIKEEPRRLDMESIARETKELPVNLVPPCGTVCCISGWASVLSRPDTKLMVSHNFLRTPGGRYLDVLDGQEQLGLTFEQGHRLFDLSGWPALYRNAYREALTPAQKTSVTLKRIDHFVRTRGKE